MKIPVEEIINRCEGLYRISQVKKDKLIEIQFQNILIGFLDACVIFGDISKTEYANIFDYYNNKFTKKENKKLLLGYDTSKISMEIKDENNNSKQI